MATKTKTGIGLALAGILALAAAGIAALGPVIGVAEPGAAGLHGFGAITLLPFEGLLLLTLVAYALALFLPQDRLALAQAVAIALYGIVMILAGLALIVTGLARFAGLMGLLLAFPFGTIAYFVAYGCGGGELSGLSAAAHSVIGGGCFTGVQLTALAAVVLDLAALTALLLAAWRFLKVRGLLWLVALATAVGVAIFGVLWVLSGLSFLIYPADALLSACLGIVILIYGAVVFVKSLLALALAIAGQVG
jgi:hypothetical protein